MQIIYLLREGGASEKLRIPILHRQHKGKEATCLKTEAPTTLQKLQTGCYKAQEECLPIKLTGKAYVYLQYSKMSHWV